MLHSNSKWAPLVLRLVLGVTLIFAALEPVKIFNPKAFVDIVRTMAGGYLPDFLIVAYGYAIPYLELTTGVLLVLGLLTRLTGLVAALMFASFIIGIGLAMPEVTFLMDPVAKLIPNKDFAYFGMAIALALTGGGAWSLDKKME